MKRLAPLITIFVLVVATHPLNAQSDDSISIKKHSNKVSVKIGGQLFTEYDFASYKKPIFYPVFGPDQVPMTRSHPMKKVAGEATDHPHHKSIWTGHIINGVDFWSEKGGTVKHQEFITIGKDSFSVRNHWIPKDAKTPLLSDVSKFRFGGDNKIRWMDVTIRFDASHGDFSFDDTKEGLFAIRTHPGLRINPVDKKRKGARASNSNGEKGKAIWGKAAAWVSYSGVITLEDETQRSASLHFFDHPSNFRHPTTWHAREYGLVAANPFGLHYFQGKPKKFGAHKVVKGQGISFRYRLVFQVDAQTDKDIDQLYREFAEAK